MSAVPLSADFESWYSALAARLDKLDEALDSYTAHPVVEEIGQVLRVDGGIAEVSGLPGVGSEELVRFPGGRLGMAYDLAPDRLGAILIDAMGDLAAGDVVHRTGG
jgi:F-type H+/Na+-transporting ATPase subunit alpha